MNEAASQARKGASTLTVVILAVIVIMAVLAVFLSLVDMEFGKAFLSGDAIKQYVAGGVVYELIFILLTIAADVLYILGGGVIAFGAGLLTVRFIQVKLKDPYKLASVSHYLSGYLSLSLEFFIGAEIIKTVAVRTYDEFTLLILVILSRGLFSLILYLDRRWHGAAESE